MPSTAPHVFVSYSSVDSDFANRLASALEQAGIPYFQDKKRIELGDDFKARISRGLEQATDLVLIASPSSMESPWVFFEVGQAVALRQRVIPLLVHPGQRLPSFLSDFQRADSIEHLVNRLRQRAEEAKLPKTLVVASSAAATPGKAVELSPSPQVRAFLHAAPSTWFGGNVAVDGALELFSFPDHGNRYGGIVKEQLTTRDLQEEWSDGAKRDMPTWKLDALGQELRSWIGPRRAKPNRIRVLLEAPAQMVLDNHEFQMSIGNSDYFTMRTIDSLAKRSHGSADGGPIAQVFSSWWAEAGTRFGTSTVPCHLSALGVLFVTDPSNGCRYLVLTLPNAQRSPLVPGWNASFAEQMWAPSPSGNREPWWKPYVSDLSIEAPKDRTGDPNIWATVTRGLTEELGVTEADLNAPPRLVCACLEQDMHFLGFIFVLQASLTLDQLQRRRLSSTDREIGAVAAYPIDGTAADGTRLDARTQLARILSMDRFDGGPYLLPRSGPSLSQGWHLSSRLRIYVAARHLEGNAFQDYVSTVAVADV